MAVVPVAFCLLASGCYTTAGVPNGKKDRRYILTEFIDNSLIGAVVILGWYVKFRTSFAALIAYFQNRNGIFVWSSSVLTSVMVVLMALSAFVFPAWFCVVVNFRIIPLWSNKSASDWFVNSVPWSILISLTVRPNWSWMSAKFLLIWSFISEASLVLWVVARMNPVLLSTVMSINLCAFMWFRWTGPKMSRLQYSPGS